MRKYLGLLSLWFLLLHIIMSLILLNPGYYGKFYITKDGVRALEKTGVPLTAKHMYQYAGDPREDDIDQEHLWMGRVGKRSQALLLSVCE